MLFSSPFMDSKRPSEWHYFQKVLARIGLAVVYTQYLRNCPNAATIEQAEAIAKQQRVGVWGDEQFVMPSIWRPRNQSEIALVEDFLASIKKNNSATLRSLRRSQIISASQLY